MWAEEESYNRKLNAETVFGHRWQFFPGCMAFPSSGSLWAMGTGANVRLHLHKLPSNHSWNVSQKHSSRLGKEKSRIPLFRSYKDTRHRWTILCQMSRWWFLWGVCNINVTLGMASSWTFPKHNVQEWATNENIDFFLAVIYLHCFNNSGFALSPIRGQIEKMARKK